jgi:DNA-binding CsgD family transcriptional regulator
LEQRPVHNPQHPGRYLAGSLVVLIAWTVVAVTLLTGESFDSNGPLSLHQPQLRSALPGSLPTEELLELCFPAAQRSRSHYYKIVGGEVDGRVLHACYELDADGWVLRTKVVDGDGLPVQDVGAVKRGGAWPWVGQLNSGTDIVGAVLLAAILLLLIGGIYARERPLPPGDSPPWTRAPALWLLLAVPVLGWLRLVTLPGVSPERRWWLLRRIGLVVLVLVANRSLLLSLRWPADPLGVAGALLPIVACAYGLGAGRLWLAGAAPPEPAGLITTAPAEVAPPVPPATGERAAAAEAPDGQGSLQESLQGGPFELTRRELDVLRHLAAGRSNAEIAKVLFVSEATVKSHVGRLFSKLGCSNRVQAALYAREHGLAGDRD